MQVASELESLVQNVEESTTATSNPFAVGTESNGTKDIDILSEPPDFERGLRFWLVMSCLLLSFFMASLDVTVVSTALPTIAVSFNGGQLSGRRPVLSTCLLLFMIGTSLSGGAQTISMLIAGRAIQGAGAGGLIAMTQIILSDLVPLSVRGKYQGLFGLVTAFACGIGPFIGGAFATRKDWSWRGLFYFNLPLAGIAILLSLFCVDLKAPDLTLAQKFRRIDWIGNFVITASVASLLIGLTWGGNQFPWSSVHVLVPTVLGIFGIFTWVFYEIWLAKRPFLISRLFINGTAISGYFQTAIHGVILASTLFALPVFFQACQNASAIRSGVDVLPFTLIIAPMALFAGAAAAGMKKYRVQILIAWCFIMIGMGLLTTLQVTISTGIWVGFEIIAGLGVGPPYTSTIFPVLAPLPISDNGTALAFLTFVRWIFQALGTTITAAVVQNQLKLRIPPEVVQDLPTEIDLIYSAIPYIPSLPDDLQLAVRTAFAQSLRTLWFVLLGISVLGFLSSLVVKDIVLHERKDEQYQRGCFIAPRFAKTVN